MRHFDVCCVQYRSVEESLRVYLRLFQTTSGQVEWDHDDLMSKISAHFVGYGSYQKTNVLMKAMFDIGATHSSITHTWTLPKLEYY